MNLTSRPAWAPGAYPNVERAVKDIAYDNGAIHRNYTEEALMKRVMTYLIGTSKPGELSSANDELGALSNDDFETVTCGEQGAVVISNITERVLSEAFDAL